MADTNLVSQGESVRNRIMEAIIGYISEHQYPPTVREIADMVDLKSTSSAQAHIKKLMAEGKLETDTDCGAPRALRVPGYKFVKV